MCLTLGFGRLRSIVVLFALFPDSILNLSCQWITVECPYTDGPVSWSHASTYENHMSH